MEDSENEKRTKHGTEPSQMVSLWVLGVVGAGAGNSSQEQAGVGVGVGTDAAAPEMVVVVVGGCTEALARLGVVFGVEYEKWTKRLVLADTERVGRLPFGLVVGVDAETLQTHREWMAVRMDVLLTSLHYWRCQLALRGDHR